MNNAVIDASVLTDMILIDRARHKDAVALFKFLQDNNIKITIPMHAVLEVKCAIGQERLTPGKGILGFEFPSIVFETVPIDDNFIIEYMDQSVPYIKAGDLIYILIALKKNIPLITEDITFLRVANQAGVKSYKIDEFMNIRKR